jgi:predicted acylesterase/phospholipase RssA/CRP-like cAMP-binding protein
MSKAKQQPSRAELLNHIRGSFLFKDLREDILEELSHDLVWVSLEPGEYLFRENDESDSTYFLTSGQLEIFRTAPNGEEVVIMSMQPDRWVGEVGVFTGQRRTAGIKAEAGGRATLVRVPGEGFTSIAAKHPDVAAQVGDSIRKYMYRDQLAAMLPKLFGPLDDETFNRIEAVAEWVQVPRGDLVLKQGDPGGSLFILIRGRLQALIANEDGIKIPVGEITPGESVGEMAMFTGEACAADVRAVRDSVLVKFSKEVFDKSMDKYPQVIREITKIVIGRLRRLINRRTMPQCVTNIAIIPTSDEVPVAQFCERLTRALSEHGRSTCIDSAGIDSTLGVKNISQSDPDNPLNIKLAAWLDAQETANRFVVYKADGEMSEWTRRALRQADRILLVGQAADDPAVSLFEARVNKIAAVRKDLILLYPDGHRVPKGTIKWLEPRQVKRHHHIRWNLDSDFERLGRFMAGKAIGLCLGGGGARGFAHFGVLQTLEETGVPIDIIGGNSIGAYVSGIYATGYAKGWDLKTMIAATRKVFSRWFFHVTPPVTSMIADGILVHDIKACVGDTQIEDLWLPFFCVSSNLTRAEVKTHKTGDLWRAIRVSGGLPGIVPPLVYDGDLHVDGALLNNLPIDVMSEMCDGGEIIAIDVSPIVDMGENTPYGDTLSGFDLIANKVNPFAKPLRIPNMLTIMQRSAEIGAVLQLRGIVDKLNGLYISMPVEHFDILGFKEAEKIVCVGYAEAQRRLLPWITAKQKADALAKQKGDSLATLRT